MYLTFDTEAKANLALTKINENYCYDIVGVNARTGNPDASKQLTTTWSKVKKVHDQDKWYFQKPDHDKMTNVTDYSEEEYDESWSDIENLG